MLRKGFEMISNANSEKTGVAGDFEKMSVEDVFDSLGSTATGLSNDEARRRLETYGPNALSEVKKTPLLNFLRYFWGPIPWMIEIAAVLSVVVGAWDDFAIILVMLLFNAMVGFWEEHKASNALDALKGQLALKARALRDGQWLEIDATNLVPGDVVRLRMGDVMPADAKLFDGDYISVDQAALTGESLPVGKKIGDIAYSGSVAKQGEMSAVVTRTGSETFFGRTAKLVETAGAVSHFQKAVMRIGDFLIGMAIALGVVLVIVELAEHVPVLHLVQFVLILVIASIPVAMPAVLSVTMALGALVLSKRKAIVSRLQAIEEMAGVDVLCSDKTGTLTQNKLEMGEPVVFEAANGAECILAGALASKAENKDAIDLAVIASLANPNALKEYTQSKFVPFDPVRKRTEAVATNGQGQVLHYTKGAPQVILDMCNLDEPTRSKADSIVGDFAVRGYRTLGVARSDDGVVWRFLGILPMSDPPRADSAETIARAKKYGIDVKMVTGDNLAIGREISGQLGMGTRIQPAGAFFPAGSNPDALDAATAKKIETSDGFAEVFPEHKYGIVKALQARGHIVAMTGDGVNDAPALKQAEVGIAVEGATDAARAAAAMILTAPGLGVIIQAVETARKIFERMMSYTIYRIAMTIDIMFFVVLAMLCYPTVRTAGGGLSHFEPLTAVMIIILALLDDIPIMTIAYDNTYLDSKPVRWDMRRVLGISSTLGLLAVVQTFGLLVVMREVLPNLETMLPGLGLKNITIDGQLQQTMLFLQLVAGGHLMLFVTRTKKFFLARPWPGIQLLLAIVGTQIFATIMCWQGWLVPALSWSLIGMVWLYNIVWVFVQDAVKLGVYRMFNNIAHRKHLLLKTANTPLGHYGTLHQ